MEDLAAKFAHAKAAQWRKLEDLWFNPKYFSERFNVSNLVDVLDEKLCVLKLPSFVARWPRPIKTHFSY